MVFYFTWKLLARHREEGSMLIKIDSSETGLYVGVRKHFPSYGF